MKILVTGGFGNVGLSVINELKIRNHEIQIFDIRNKKNRKHARLVKNDLTQLFWGDIRNSDILEKAVNNCDCIIHLAAIVPPISEINKEDCFNVNANGTKNVINSILNINKSIPFVYVSSASVMGSTQSLNPPVNTCRDVNPIMIYSKSKAIAEDYVKKSGLKYCILRLTSVMDSSADYSDDMLKLLFEFPLECRNEIILDSDAATAIVTATEKLVSSDEINNMIYFIGGGDKNGCQLYNKHLFKSMFDAMGIGMLSEDCFKKDNSDYSMDWYDTEDSNEILNYQNHTFDDYIDILKKKTKSGGIVVKYMAPKLKRAMELSSPYFRDISKEK